MASICFEASEKSEFGPLRRSCAGKVAVMELSRLAVSSLTLLSVYQLVLKHLISLSLDHYGAVVQAQLL